MWAAAYAAASSPKRISLSLACAAGFGRSSSSHERVIRGSGLSLRFFRSHWARCCGLRRHGPVDPRHVLEPERRVGLRAAEPQPVRVRGPDRHGQVHRHRGVDAADVVRPRRHGAQRELTAGGQKKGRVRRRPALSARPRPVLGPPPRSSPACSTRRPGLPGRSRAGPRSGKGRTRSPAHRAADRRDAEPPPPAPAARAGLRVGHRGLLRVTRLRGLKLGNFTNGPTS